MPTGWCRRTRSQDLRRIVLLVLSLLAYPHDGRLQAQARVERPTEARTGQVASDRPEIEFRRGTVYPPAIAVRGVLTEAPFEALVRSGFPARLHVRAELWSMGRWFDDVAGRTEWDLVLRYDVVDRVYDVVRVAGDRVIPLGSYARFADARAAMELPVPPTLPALRPGRRGYVLVQAELQVLEVSDLDELDRWIRGEAGPAVRGERNPAGAVTRGLRTLASRILGGEVRRLEAKTPAITF